MYQLYYARNNASIAPHMLLHHMRLDYELVLVDRKANAQKSASYLKLNPAGRVPTLVHNGQAIFESPAICIHLCEQHPEHQLMPPLGSPLRPLFFQWLAYLNNTLQTALLVYYYPQRHTTDETAINGVKAAERVQIGNALSVLDKQLQQGKYLLGEQISACDFFLVMLCGWLPNIEDAKKQCPNLVRYLREMAKHPTVKAVYEKEGVSLACFG
ncbi:glutathione S-transferase family protein [Enterovibrio sp. ZSDZ35]|uniref:Glutathione S-transferase family protein n=1 Tax=Enterovibrio qingdaonensis TaxID=2899818 RepID=A0ABT5QLF5_9GAMM|nr:glutathione S-transferase family protein [Enterovibrio sp. ZSDZ35]MDD1781141.1 glutathione S-transferase family protein [Enterovibrio sp. ZSDZ35]